MKSVIDDQLKTWLRQGVIKEVDYTPKAVTPMLVVPKPRSEKLRVCLDFRLVNACCKQVYAQPIDRHALINDLSKRKIFSTIDVASAFLCVRIARQLQSYFGIQFEGRHFVFERLPFGFHNSMNFFLRAMNSTIARARRKIGENSHIVSYVDDICVASDTEEDHKKALDILFGELQQDGWTVQLEKCNLFKKEVLFLGIRYTAKGIFPDPEIIAKLSNLPEPKTSSELRTLFGLCICLQQFNYKLQRQLAPLRMYSKEKPQAFQTEAFKKTWRKCIEEVGNTVWYSTPIDKLSQEAMTVFVDSSSDAHGAVLFQGKKLITMWSAVNKRPHASSAESEVEGLCRALKAFRPYLVQVPFTVMTDNRAALACLNANNQSDTIKRRLDEIQYWFGRHCTIKHIAGKANRLADLLSRSRYLTRRREHDETVKCQPVHERPSEDEIQAWIEKAHFGHWASEATYQNLLLEGRKWPSMREDVRRYVARCDNCAFSGQPQTRDIPKVEVTTHIGENVHMDHTGPFFDGSHILVIVDDATKWVETKRVPGTGTVHALQALDDWIRKNGPIKCLRVDNATGWNSTVFRSWLMRNGVYVQRSPSYYHQGNSLAERTIQTLQTRIRRMLNGSRSQWPGVIRNATEAMNIAWHSATGTAPIVLMKGRDRNNVPMSVEDRQRAWQLAEDRQHARKAYERWRFQWKHPRRSRRFRVGESVLRRDPLHERHPMGKLGPTWLGPFVIVAQHSNSTWLISHPNSTHPEPPFLVHSSQIKPYID